MKHIQHILSIILGLEKGNTLDQLLGLFKTTTMMKLEGMGPLIKYTRSLDLGGTNWKM